MRFVCESCQAQYSIGDEKVGPTGAKVRCKTCGHVNWVLRPAGGPSSSTADVGQMTQVWQNPLVQTDAGDADKTLAGAAALSALSEDDVGAAFDEILKSRPNIVPPDDDGDRTRIMSAVGPGERTDVGHSPESEPEFPRRVGAKQWYVAINDKQVGPLSIEGVKGHFEKGEIGPDSLCWHNGMSDWVALAEVQELASVLAPRRSKPVVVNTSSASIESVFAAGNATAPAAKTANVVSSPASDWKPSAASALASLVKEEVQAMSEKKATISAPDEAAPVPDIVAELNMTRPPPPVVPGYPAPGMYPGYGAPPSSSSKALMVGLVFLGVVLVALVVLVAVVALRGGSQIVIPVQEIASGAPSKSEGRDSKTQAKVEVPAAAVVEAKTEKEVAPSREEAAKSTESAEEPVKEAPLEIAGSRKGPPASSRKARERTEKPVLVEPVAAAQPKAENVEPPKDEFEKVFGVSDPKQFEPTVEPKKRPTVYVPPAPGGGDVVLKELGQSDIQSVVVANLSAIQRCVDEQRKRSPGVKGTLTMQWTVQPSGKTTNVQPITEEFSSEYIASCIGSLVKKWTFPKHKVQGEPIKYPFRF